MPIYGTNKFEIALKKSNLKISINKIVKWLKRKHKVNTIFVANCEDEYIPWEHIIHINSRSNLKVQLNALLHEAGHVIVRQNQQEHKKKFPGIYLQRETKKMKIDILREEVLAWEEGLKIAKLLKIAIEEKTFDKHRHSALSGYVEWAN